MPSPQLAQDRYVRKIFIGGYTKSGTTFIGRAFDLFQGVYAKGELDYFRIFYEGMGELANNYNINVNIVNKEVYDGFGSLEPLNANTFRQLHEKIFRHLFFSARPLPDDCTTIVEKSPRNIFWLSKIRKVFPDAMNLAVYRPPLPVFRSLVRHMADHRDEKFADPTCPDREEMLSLFVKRWGRMIAILETERALLRVIQYESAAKDNEALVAFLGEKILGGPPELEGAISSLSKENYLKSLPEEARAKSLVQTGPYKIQLSDEEIGILEKNCRAPNISFDF